MTHANHPTSLSRRSRFLVAVGLLIVVVGVVDCGGLTAEESYVSKLSDAHCGWARACCELDEVMGILDLKQSDAYSYELARTAMASHDKCVDLVHSSLVTSERILLESIRVGRVKLDSAKLDACIKLYEAAKGDCGKSPMRKAVTDACKASVLFTGQQAANAVCYLDVDCAAGNTCWGLTGGAPGVCRAKAAEGQACRSNAECPDTASCAPVATHDSWCASSDRQASGQFCASDSQCAAGLFCDTNAQQCAEPVAAGGECFQNRQCLSRRCNQDQRTCEAPGAVGGVCDISGHCQSDLWCDTSLSTKACTVPLSTRQAGETCDSVTPCASGLACLGGFCVTPRLAGAPCSAQGDCQTGLFCDTMNGSRCAQRKAKGATCRYPGTGTDCAAGLFCSTTAPSTCVDRVALGAACTGTLQCVETARCNPATGKCEAPLTAGAACSSGADCASGLLCQHWEGRCAARSSSGAMCEASEACPASEYCGTGGGSICQLATKVGAGQSCNSTSAVCDDAYYCTSSSVCAARLAEDAGCASASSGCAAGTYCSPYASNRCTRYAAAQAPCSSIGYPSPLCAPGTLCTPGTLADGGSGCAPGHDAGTECDSAADCASGLLCPTTTSVCTAPLATGAACAGASTMCGTGSWCRTFVGTCAARLAEGVTCTSSGACATNLGCEDHKVCTAKAKADEACETDRPCGDGLRCDAEWGTCVALRSDLGLGASCRSGAECASGSCSGQQCVGLCEGVNR